MRAGGRLYAAVLLVLTKDDDLGLERPLVSTSGGGDRPGRYLFGLRGAPTSL